MDHYTKTTKKCLEELQSSPNGLSKSEVIERQKQYGLNVLIVKGIPLWRKLTEPFTNVFMLVLFIAAVVSLLHQEYIDASIIGVIMGVNAIIYYIQQFSTERILRSLQEKNKHIVNVIRDNKTIQIDAIEIVPGDILILDEGDKIPADCRLIEASSFRVDESQLTGESVPVNKISDELSGVKEIYERSNMIYRGSFVIGGQAKALVISTGNDTEFGKLAVLSVGECEESPVQKRINKLITVLVRVISGVAIVAFILSLYRGMDIVEAFRYILALSVSAVPESLPVAITVVLILGMRRMAKKKALVKSPSAIENIGIVTTIASDKTGTLTKNLLTVQKIWGCEYSNNEVSRAIAYSYLHTSSKNRDPLDVAMNLYADDFNFIKPDIKKTLPFDQIFAMSGNVVNDKDGVMLYVKGAPEHVVDRCSVPHKELESIHNKVKSMAANGLRVLALASMKLDKEIDSFEEISDKSKFDFIGLIGIADVLRKEAKDAVSQARNAGIRVYMVTGDHFETAFHIGRQLGIVGNSNEVFDCRKMHEVGDDKLSEIVEKTRVFARVIPENKHRLLTILKQSQITAMTGDGVNDVPALTSAHIGVAMGSGTSIAKDAGDIILLDNNFYSIVQAIHEGRTIYANIKRMVVYLLSTNAGEVLITLGSLIIGVPVPIIAVQILWVNLVTDTCMVIPIGLEPGEKRNMLRPPVSPNSPLFSKFMLSRIAIAAFTMAAVALSLYIIFIHSNGVDYARVIAFNAIVVMQWANAFNSRSDYESLFIRIRHINWSFYAGLSVAIVCQIFAVSGFMRDILHIKAVISTSDLVITTTIAFIIPILVTEFHKWVGRHFFNKGNKN